MHPLPLSDEEDLKRIYLGLKALPQAGETPCSCGGTVSFRAPQMYARCPQCGLEQKLRSFGSADELEDLVDLVLTWLAQDRENLALLAERIEAKQGWGIWDDHFAGE